MVEETCAKPLPMEALAHEDSIGPDPLKAATSRTGCASVPPPGNPAAHNEASQRAPEVSIPHLPAAPDHPGQIPQEDLGRPATNAAPEPATSAKPAPSPASLSTGKGVDEAQLIKADSLRREAQIVKTASANRRAGVDPVAQPAPRSANGVNPHFPKTAGFRTRSLFAILPSARSNKTALPG